MSRPPASPDRKSSPAIFHLPPDEVHVWRITLARLPVPLAELEQLIDGREQRQACRFRHTQDREQHIASRGFRRLLLARYLQTAPRDLKFEYNHFGKARLPGSALPHPLRFNTGHSGGVILFALANNRETGVDVERLRPLADMQALARRCFTSREFEAWHRLPEPEQRKAFFRVWTRKEAFLKAYGRGLSLAPELVEVTVPADRPPRLLSVEGEPAAHREWDIRDLPADEGFAAAIAVENRDRVCWKLRESVWTGTPVPGS